MADQSGQYRERSFIILIVEDNKALASLMQRRLVRSGHNALTAGTGGEALEALKKGPVDLLVLDYKLPDMNAIELIKILKDKQLNTPFVIVTGVGDERIAVEIMKLGAKDYIIKDTNLLDFLPTVVQRIKEEIQTHRKLFAAETALLESELKYKLLVENIDIGILLINTNSEVITANAAIGRMLNRNSEQLIGKNIFEEIPFYTQNLETESVTDLLISDKPVENDVELILGDDRILKIRLRAFPYFTPGGELLGYIGVFEDVTEKKFLEEQLIQAQKMEAVGIMAGGIAHDFNNLLTAIQGHAELALLESSEETNIYSEIQGIVRSVKMGSDLTSQLLLFSRKQPLKLKKKNINEVIENMNNMLHRILNKTVVLEQELENDLWDIKADAGNIEQVILNLAINAKDAMAGGGTLSIKTRNTEISPIMAKKFTNAKPGKYVQISIQDNGEGIDMAILPRIFEPFFTTKKEGKGTGLGLAIVYSIVNKHNGWIDIKSQKGKGTTFNIYFKAVFQE